MRLAGAEPNRDVYLGLTPSLRPDTRRDRHCSISGRGGAHHPGFSTDYNHRLPFFFNPYFRLFRFVGLLVSALYNIALVCSVRLVLSSLHRRKMEEEEANKGGERGKGGHRRGRPRWRDSQRHSIATLTGSVSTATNRIRHWATMQTSRLRLSSIIQLFHFLSLPFVFFFFLFVFFFPSSYSALFCVLFTLRVMCVLRESISTNCLHFPFGMFCFLSYFRE